MSLAVMRQAREEKHVTDRIGQTLGKYRLTHLVGQGGFAEVYLGVHVHLGTPAAIKLLHTLTRDPWRDRAVPPGSADHCGAHAPAHWTGLRFCLFGPPARFTSARQEDPWKRARGFEASDEGSASL